MPVCLLPLLIGESPASLKVGELGYNRYKAEKSWFLPCSRLPLRFKLRGEIWLACPSSEVMPEGILD